MNEITIDRKTLKALGADTRLNILKSLTKRRKTQAELAKELQLSAPSIKEHVGQLLSAQLVEVIDTGRKWKYYSLTQKGKAIAEPMSAKIWFILGITLLTIVGIAFFSFPANNSGNLQTTPSQEYLTTQNEQASKTNADAQASIGNALNEQTAIAVVANGPSSQNNYSTSCRVFAGEQMDQCINCFELCNSLSSNSSAQCVEQCWQRFPEARENS